MSGCCACMIVADGIAQGPTFGDMIPKGVAGCEWYKVLVRERLVAVDVLLGFGKIVRCWFCVVGEPANPDAPWTSPWTALTGVELYEGRLTGC